MKMIKVTLHSGLVRCIVSVASGFSSILFTVFIYFFRVFSCDFYFFG